MRRSAAGAVTRRGTQSLALLHSCCEFTPSVLSSLLERHRTRIRIDERRGDPVPLPRNDSQNQRHFIPFARLRVTARVIHTPLTLVTLPSASAAAAAAAALVLLVRSADRNQAPLEEGRRRVGGCARESVCMCVCDPQIVRRERQS